MFRYFHAPRLRQAGRLLPFSLLLVAIAVAGAAGNAGAAPLTGPKPTRVPGLTPVTNCSANPGGDLDAHITDHPDHTTAVFTNSSRDCSYQIGLATYKKVDDNIDHQILFAGQTAVIAPNSTMTLQVGNPSCAYQGDAFWGRMLTSLAGGLRYNERLLDDTDGVNSAYCTVEATATPTQQAVPPTATATAAAATATETAVPPSATATATTVPPTNTPTNTPTPGAQKIRPTNTPTAPPAGGPPAPTATATAVAVVAPPTATAEVAPPTATTIVVVGPPAASPTATAVVVAPTNTPAPVVGGIGAPPAATATNTPVSTVEGIAPPAGPPAGAPSAPAPPSAPATGSGKQGAGPVNRVGPLVGANNGPAPAALPPTGTADAAWLLWLALAGLAVGSGVLLRRAARQRTS